MSGQAGNVRHRASQGLHCPQESELEQKVLRTAPHGGKSGHIADVCLTREGAGFIIGTLPLRRPLVGYIGWRGWSKFITLSLRKGIRPAIL